MAVISQRIRGARSPLIAGELDTPVIWLNHEALQRLAADKQLEIVPGATQLFEEPGALEAVARLARGWFEQHLARAGAVA